MAFSETGKVWMNGKLLDWKDATIHVATHVVHYGTGVFEGIRAYDSARGPNVFRLTEHMRRLWDSCRVYRMEPRVSFEELHEAVLETIRANGFQSCYIRPLVYRGYSQLGVNPIPCPVDVAVIVWEWGQYLGEDAQVNGVDVGVSSWTRLAPNTLPAMAKATANYANSGLIKMQATVDGYAEGIALDESGLLSEGSGQNLFLVRDNVVYTPSLASSVLEGITRNTVIQLTQDLGFEVREQPLPREFLYLADEVFFCGTAVEVTPIRSVDKITVGSGKRGPVTAALQERFFGIVRGEQPDLHHWLTPVGSAVAAR
ncbi:MAG TPA: branched-chain amino acid transaminase [Vicinamibacterales bacterium]|nr:branched-chain amino acid transaminase [Vicinamibacterales bacterium]